MGALVVACGVATTRPDSVTLPERPGKDDFDPLLQADVDRVVVIGSDAALGAVVLRLLRRDRLDVAVGFVPEEPGRSAAARVWGLPAAGALELALELALAGEVRPLPLVRDDFGGVLMGRGVIGPVSGEAYCDDQLALRGQAARIEVSPDPGGGVTGTVVTRGLLRSRRASYRGRAFQTGCHPATVTVDGVAHPRTVQRWTWYRHTADLRAVRQSPR